MKQKYLPPPTVDRFIQSEKQFSFIIGPIGSGKTTGALMKMLYHAGRQDPSPKDGIRRTRFLVVRNTYKELLDTTCKSFFGWFPPGVAGEWVSTRRDFTIKSVDIHCEILFRALDNADDASSVLSLEITGAMIDEFVEIPREIVDAVESRTGRYPAAEGLRLPAGTVVGEIDAPEVTGTGFVMRSLMRVRAKHGAAVELEADVPVEKLPDGQLRLLADADATARCTWKGVWGASNAGTQDSWWYDWLYSPWEDDADGRTKRESLAFFEQPGGFDPRAENLRYLPGRAEFYVEKARGKTKEWVNQFINCIWGFSVKGKAVYPVFRRALHVAENPLQYNPTVPLVIGFDAGLTPSAVLTQQDAFGRVLVLRVLTSKDMGAKRFCATMLKPLLAREFPGAEVRVAADPATNQRAQTDERTVAELVSAALGVKVWAPTTNALAARLGAVETLLTRLTEAGPALLMDKSCRALIVGFEAGYRFALNRKGQRGAEPEKNEYSHPHDALQYACLYYESGAKREARRAAQPARRIGYTNGYTAR